MSKKNSIVLNRKGTPESLKRLSLLYSEFKKKLNKLKSNKFLISVSGGPDSLALAALCKTYATENKKKSFVYININHAIRKNSLKESLLVKKILRKQKIFLKILSNKFKIKNNIQHNARKIRYDLLSKECIKYNIKYILTAHHKNDQIETFLIRLSRGSGIQGLSSMNTISALNKKIKIFRPLLDFEKKDLQYLSKKTFGTYIKDPSNKDQKFLRVKIRQLLPLLEKHGVKKNLMLKTIKNLQSTSQIINSYFLNIYNTIVKKEKRKYMIKKREFISLNREVKLKILGIIFKKINNADYPPRAKKILNAIDFLEKGDNKSYSLSKCAIRQDNGSIIIEKEVKN